MDRILRRRDIEAKWKAAIDRLKSEGCPLMPAPQWDTFPATSRAQRLGKSQHGVVDVSVAKHRKETCHAAFVDRQGEVVYICTDPRRHQLQSQEAATTRKAQLAAARVARKTLREAHAARPGVLVSALRNGRLP